MRVLNAFALAGVLAAAAPVGQAGAQDVSATRELNCPLPSQAMMRAELLFGRNIGGRLAVTEQAFARFVAAEITPRFPAGLTVIDAAGQWRDSATGRIVREKSKLVVLMIGDAPAARERIAAIAQAYKTRFHQQSVGVVTRPVCAAF
jgi:hypothetical protein